MTQLGWPFFAVPALVIWTALVYLLGMMEGHSKGYKDAIRSMKEMK